MRIHQNTGRSGSRLGVAGAATAAMLSVVAGCGSGHSSTTAGSPDSGSSPVTTEYPVQQVSPVAGSVNTSMWVAVGDATHAMLLTYDSTDGATPGDHISASVVAGNNKAAPVDLPTLQSPMLVPWSGGYAVGGVHCGKVHMMGEESVCDNGVPVVVFFDATGALKAMVAISVDTNVRPDMVRTVAGGDEVIMRTDEDSWYTVTPAGSEKLPAMPNSGDVCRLRDGTVVAATEVSKSTDPDQAESAPGVMQLWDLADGKWNGPFKSVPYAKNSFPLTNCVPGGFVTSLGTITEKGTFDAPTPLPSGTSADTSGMTTGWADGFDSSNRLYISLPPSMNKPPQILDNSSSPVKIAASDRWVGLSSNGKNVALGATPADLRIVPTT